MLEIRSRLNRMIKFLYIPVIWICFTGDPLCKDGYARFSTVLLIALYKINIVCLYNLFIFICGFFAKVTRAIFLMINNGEIHRNKHDVIFHIFNQVKVLSLKGTVLYRVCMDGHLKYALQA